MIIDCDTCEVRGLACDDCVVSVLLGGRQPELDEGEQAAIDVLAESGLVPPLRLVRALDAPPAEENGDGRRQGPGSSPSAAAG
jgi:hypothetical protein